MAEQERRGEGLLAQLSSTRERSTRSSTELNELRSALQQLRGRQASLEALQQAAMEDGNEAVGDWLQAQQLTQRPRLLEQMQVDEGWQLAVETVLADHLQAVCVDQVGPLGSMLDSLEQGQLMLLEAGQAPAAAPHYLAAKVRSGGRTDALLAGVRVAEDLGQAMQQRAGLAPHESIITREGVWLGPNWMRISRLSAEQGGVIQRQQELEVLATQIAEHERRETALEQGMLDAQEMLKRLEEQRQDSQRELQASTRQHAEFSSQLSAAQARLEQLNARRERLVADIAEAREQFAHEQEAIAEARQLLSEAIERMEHDSQRREALLSERDQTRGTLDSARQKARHDKDASHQVAMRYQSLQTQLNSMRDSIERTDRQVAQLRERRDNLAASLAENDNPLEGLQAELEEQLGLRLETEGELSIARQSVAEVEHQLREAEQQRASIEHRAETVRSELEQKRIGNQSLQVQRENVHQQLVDSEHQVDEVLQSLSEGAEEQEWQLSLERVANRIARLGPINLAAIEEYTLQSERKTYLDTQNEDLETALETLQSAIRKIDKETRSRFRDTFDKVNNGLQELFPRVFGGGSAYLEMTGDDLLDTGISIMARPPGKKNSTIHLLSGGEKALTAIALVFSIFQLNPAPFCMLDEVDAPLDDANVGRYARMVKEMAEKVQFIYITHNKISMELADQLMGVTMHEPGVSRLVTVDVDEAAELAAS
jgi:chromosome segregation protein